MRTSLRTREFGDSPNIDAIDGFLVTFRSSIFEDGTWPSSRISSVNPFSRSRPGLAGVTHKGNEQSETLPGARYGWESGRAGSPHRIAANFALRSSQGHMAAKAMMALRNRGFDPRLIIGHLGWGETLFAKDVFPAANLIVHAEFFYSARGADVGFDPEFPDGGMDHLFELRAKNAA